MKDEIQRNGGRIMGEHVQISLDRYNDYLYYKEKFDSLIDVYNELVKIVGDEEFDLDNKIHSKIFEIYERLCNEI